MSCQILNCLGVNRSVNQIGDIGVAELMGSYVGHDACILLRVENKEENTKNRTISASKS